MILNYVKNARFIKALCVRLALTKIEERCCAALEASEITATGSGNILAP